MSSETPRDRLENTLKSPYDPDGEVWSALLASLGAEFEDHETALAEVDENKFIDTASPESLERLASIFDIERREDSIAVFRARLKTALRSQITSATIEEIRDVTAVILDGPIGAVDILESESQFAFIRLEVDLNEIDELRVTPVQLSEIVESVTAAGVGVGVNIFISETATLVLDATSQNTTLNDEGLSAETLAPLSSSDWTLSRGAET